MTSSGGNGKREHSLTDAQRRLVDSALVLLDRIVEVVAGRYPEGDPDRIRAAGYEALVRAALAFDAGRDGTFAWFAWWRVYGAARDAVGKARAFSATGRAALIATEELGDPQRARSIAVCDDADEVTRFLAEGADEVGGSYTLGTAAATLQELGEEGLVVLEDALRRRAAVRAALAAMSADDRRLVQLRFVERRRAVDVAAALGVSKSTVDRRCRAVRARLRRALAGVREEEGAAAL